MAVAPGEKGEYGTYEASKGVSPLEYESRSKHQSNTPIFSNGAPVPAGPYAYYGVADQPLPPPEPYGIRRRPLIGGRSCCAIICTILITLAILFGLAVFIFWLVIQPRALKFDIVDVRVDNLFFNSAGSASPTTTFVIVARNPNKKIGIHYDDISTSVETMDVIIGSRSLLPFYQGRRNTTNLTASLSVDSLTVNSETQNNILTAQNDGRLPLEIIVDIRGRAEIGSWNADSNSRFRVYIDCDLRIDTRLSGPDQIVDKDCNVNRRSRRRFFGWY